MLLRCKFSAHWSGGVHLLQRHAEQGTFDPQARSFDEHDWCQSQQPSAS